ncbi:MAG: histidinol-phosphate transaminase [Pseudomonadota bacterium]
MSIVTELARPEIVSMAGYTSASHDEALVRLNANESPLRRVGDTTQRGLNWYPLDRPTELERRLASLVNQPAERITVTRGSSEAIDLLIRTFCRPGEDAVLICPPTFGMYAVYANVQGATIQRAPLTAAPAFDLDVDRIRETITDATKLVFITSPNNPTGNVMSPTAVDAVVAATRGRAVVVIDAAYLEFAECDDPAQRYANESHVVVLRTLSKAFALAGARCGVIIGDTDLSLLIRKVFAPYSIATPVVEAILGVLAQSSPTDDKNRFDTLRAERNRVSQRLATLPAVRAVYRSDANFVLAEFIDPATAITAVEKVGFLIRDFSKADAHPNSLRITIGTREQNDTVLSALGTLS